MNKTFPLVLNSILFIAGIGFYLIGLPVLCIVCFLFVSLLFIWTFKLEITPDLLPPSEEPPDDTDLLRTELSLQIQELTTSNQLLFDENRHLSDELNQCKKELADKSHALYTCPLTSTLPVNLNTFFTVYLENDADLLAYRKLHPDYRCSIPEADTYLSTAALTQICDNIFDNIFKFSPAMETIYIRMTALENDSLIIFKNAGDAPEEHETGRIFDLNYQGSNKKSGCGLGLAQVKAILEDFGGQVWAKSSRDTGFTLYIRLPSRAPESQETVGE